MMDTLTYSELWSVLPPPARARACLAFWQAPDIAEQARATVLTALAGSLRFREKFLKTQSPAKKADWLLNRINQPEFRRFQGDLLTVLLLADHGPLIEQFLDVQKIPHQGSFLDGGTPPTAASLCKGIRAIRKTWGDWNTALYLGFIQTQGDDEFWAALPEALTKEGFGIRQALEQPPPTPAA